MRRQVCNVFGIEYLSGEWNRYTIKIKNPISVVYSVKLDEMYSALSNEWMDGQF